MFHSKDGYRAENGDSFFERLVWHGISGIATGLAVILVQWFLQIGAATASNHETRINALEVASAARQQEIVGIHSDVTGIREELHRLNDSIERIRK